MLVNVYHGLDAETARDKGPMHFDAAPVCGDELELERETYVVTKVWHVPHQCFAGPKTAIRITEFVGQVTVSRASVLIDA
ncbi:MAG: hypothetical protein AB7G25_04890 [Sphingomonadaceae bacterium]